MLNFNLLKKIHCKFFPRPKVILLELSNSSEREFLVPFCIPVSQVLVQICQELQMNSANCTLQILREGSDQGVFFFFASFKKKNKTTKPI